MFVGHDMRMDLAEMMRTASRGNFHRCRMVLWDVNKTVSDSVEHGHSTHCTTVSQWVPS